jgi:hypothetical protein
VVRGITLHRRQRVMRWRRGACGEALYTRITVLESLAGPALA